MIEKYTPQELVVSDAAVSRIDKLVSDEVNKEISLRVFVTGGGCSGFQYGFRLEDQLDEEDTCLLYTSPSPRDVHLSRMPSSA